MSAKYQDVKLPREQSCSEFAQNSSEALPKCVTETEQNRDRKRFRTVTLNPIDFH